MAKKFSDKFYHSKAWKTFRDMILQRDFHMCKICGKPDCKSVHHIIELTPININDATVTLNQDNCITLCEECHNRIHDRYKNNNDDIQRYTFDADGNIIPTANCDKRERQDRYTDEQRKEIEVYKARLKVGV